MWWLERLLEQVVQRCLKWMTDQAGRRRGAGSGCRRKSRRPWTARKQARSAGRVSGPTPTQASVPDVGVHQRPAELMNLAQPLVETTLRMIVLAKKPCSECNSSIGRPSALPTGTFPLSPH